MRPSTADVRQREEREDEEGVGCSLAEFKVMGELGKGAYGVVYKVISLMDGREYVLKKIPIKHLKKTEIQDVVKEAKILRKVDNLHIIKSYSHFVESGALNIVMELAEGGDLQQYIKAYKKNNCPISEAEVWRIGEELSIALVYLHENKIIHRDVKTLNVFLTRDHHVKLGDMGVSKIVKNSVASQNTRVGTPLYLAPELVKQKPYDYKIDVWAMGCILYQMCSGKAPFSGENLISLGYNIVHNQPPALPVGYSVELVDLINKLLEKNPSKRPSAEEALNLIISRKGPHSTRTGQQRIGETQTREGVTIGPNFHSLLDQKDPLSQEMKEGGSISPNNQGIGPRRSTPWRHSPKKNRSSKGLGKTESRQVPDMMSPAPNAFSPPPSGLQQNNLDEAPLSPMVQAVPVPVEGSTNANVKTEEVIKDKSKQNTLKGDSSLFQPVPVVLSNISNVSGGIQPPPQPLPTNSKPSSFVQQEDPANLPLTVGMQGGRPRAAHLQPQPSSASREQPKKEPIPQNVSEGQVKEKPVYHRPPRQIHSAQEGGRPQSGYGPRVVIQNKPGPDKMKAMEMMLKRATLNDPIYNMLKNKEQPAQVAPLPQEAIRAKAWPLETTQSRPAASDQTKKDKKTMSTLQTSANDFSMKEQQAKLMAHPRNHGHGHLPDNQEEEVGNGPMQGVSHPFLDPFRHLFTTGPMKHQLHRLEETDVEMERKIDIPKNRQRPQTASANIQTRSSTVSSSAKLITIADSADKKTYRIKTAVPGKKDLSLQSPALLGRTAGWEFVPRKITIHDV